MSEKTKNEPLWFVAHTYSGYENKVKANIEATVATRNMEDTIVEVVVPMHDVEETKAGERKVTSKKIFPGYVLVKMFMTDESWYVVRNTRGVTGFVGPASKPVPLTKEELRTLGIKEKLPALSTKVGDTVRVLSGPFEGFEGIVEEVNLERRRLKVIVNMFGRETPVEIDYVQTQKL